MLSNFITHITESLPDDEFMAKIFKSEESALEVITDVACYCFDESFRNNEIAPINVNDKDELHTKLVECFDCGHKHWLEYVEHIRKSCMIELSQLGFIMVMQTLPDNSDILKQIKEPWDKALKEVINRIAEAMQDSYKKSVNDAELAKAIDYADEDSLVEFFKTFQDLQTYFRNDEKYDTQEKIDMHRKMVQIYQQLIQHVDI